jgi:hypothetical protein
MASIEKSGMKALTRHNALIEKAVIYTFSSEFD